MKNLRNELTKIKLEFIDDNIIVYGTYYGATMGDLETPPEPEKFEIEIIDSAEMKNADGTLVEWTNEEWADDDYYLELENKILEEYFG